MTDKTKLLWGDFGWLLTLIADREDEITKFVTRNGLTRETAFHMFREKDELDRIKDKLKAMSKEGTQRS